MEGTDMVIGWWKVVLARLAVPVVAVGAGLGLVMLGGAWRDWRAEQRGAGRPVIAEPTRASEKWERQMEALTLAVAQLTEAQAAALATKYARPDVRVVPGPPGRDGAPGAPGTPGAVVLAETTSKAPAPAGVDILTTADPKTGVVQNTVVARPVSFLGAPLKWRWFAEGLTEDSAFDRYAIRAGLEFDALRIGKLHVQPKVEGFRETLPTGLVGFDEGIRAGLRITFEP